jgi:hypothetical protein
MTLTVDNCTFSGFSNRIFMQYNTVAVSFTNSEFKNLTGPLINTNAGTVTVTDCLFQSIVGPSDWKTSGYYFFFSTNSGALYFTRITFDQIQNATMVMSYGSTAVVDAVTYTNNENINWESTYKVTMKNSVIRDSAQVFLTAGGWAMDNNLFENLTGITVTENGNPNSIQNTLFKYFDFIFINR